MDVKAVLSGSLNKGVATYALGYLSSPVVTMGVQSPPNTTSLLCLIRRPSQHSSITRLPLELLMLIFDFIFDSTADI